jgi:pSer/pThr/pTyr-binding forkhead associated (FHA) protein
VTEQPSGFALRFISGKYQGGEYPLPDNREIVIGRGGELDIVLVEDMVSRKHAKITIQDAKIAIQDLGSTNGTFVNGEKIKKSRLKEGDRVLIGTSILKLVSAAEVKAGFGGTREELNANLEAIGKKGGKGELTSGSLRDVGALPDLLQILSTSKKSGVVSVKSGEDAGRIYLRNGKIYYALLNGNDELGPLKALVRMVAWIEGEFRVGAPSDEEFMLELEEPTDQLIADALRQQDELRQIQSALPELEDMLSIPRPLEAALSRLDADDLDMLQLAINLGFFQAVLDKSPFSDLRTAQLIKGLVERGYLKN